MPKISKSQNLINFIVPNHLIETFDYVCSSKAQSRSSVLKRLMDEYVEEHSFLLPTEFKTDKNTLKTESFKNAINHQPRELLTFKEWVKLNSELKMDLRKDSDGNDH